ncbi:heparinase II/III family protein [Gaetbulibacter aquiaggeris]|uniref:Heparinase II/III family protein n=1 Tax=Gaetbulibacter aquiaggeris TaxID=1735373 RepID=A0ABW7ML13_9FLAO
MNRNSFIILLAAFISTVPSIVQAQEHRNLLQKEASYIDLVNQLVSAKDFNPFPKYKDSLQWQSLDRALKEVLLDKGEQALLENWDVLTATDYRSFIVNGDRKVFENKYFSRRGRLSDLVLAEMIERKGRFLNKIVDGIYLICEESNWVIPAHGNHELMNGLEDPYVDLFAAETSSLLAWTYYLIGDQLDKITPVITQRIKVECKKRIIKPVLLNNDFWWMGFKYYEDHVVNNWNPWIASNYLSTVLILEEDPNLRDKAVKKIIEIIDNYINLQPEDGGCEEGPVYWTVAGGRVLQCLDLLQHATQGGFNVYDNVFIQNTTSFFYKSHIAKNYFVNIGDGPYVMNDRAVKVFNAGKIQNNAQLMNVAKSVTHYYNPLDEIATNKFGDMYGNLVGIFNYIFFKTYQIPATTKKESVWLPNLELLCTTISTKSKELFLSVLGAHNGQSHNHNDVGNYTIFVDGEPVIIDLGVETYTKKTFSPQRYDIWTMQSAYHNLPTINGIMQAYGAEFKTTDVVKSKNELRINIASAYPEEAKIDSWIRTFKYGRSGILILDDYRLKENSKGIVLNQMTSLKIKENKKGNIVLINDDGQNVLNLSYNPEQLILSTEEIKLTDEKLRTEWKREKLYRFQLKVKNNALDGLIKIKFF